MNAEKTYELLCAVLRENNVEQQGIAVSHPEDSCQEFVEQHFGTGALLTGEFTPGYTYLFCFEDPIWMPRELEYRSAVVNTPDGDRIFLYSLC